MRNVTEYHLDTSLHRPMMHFTNNPVTYFQFVCWHLQVTEDLELQRLDHVNQPRPVSVQRHRRSQHLTTALWRDSAETSTPSTSSITESMFLKVRIALVNF